MGSMAVSNYNQYTQPNYYGNTIPGGQTNNTGGGYNPYDVGSGDAYGDDSFSSITSLVSPAAGGAFAAYKLSGKMSESIKSIFAKKPPAGDLNNALNVKGALGGLKSVALTSIKGAGLAALVGAGVSAVGNGIGVATGAVDGSQAVGNVVGDTITSAVGGLGAVALGGGGHMLLSKMGVTGLPMTIATTALGAVGGVAAGFVKESIME